MKYLSRDKHNINILFKGIKYWYYTRETRYYYNDIVFRIYPNTAKELLKNQYWVKID